MREGRALNELRPLEIEVGFVGQADGSALISFGRTRVLCTASVDEGVPPWLSGKGSGWLTAEYGMLPASTGRRTRREASSGSQRGRTVEIQRLIGRSLRSAYGLDRLGERTVWLDCDVLQADGGTRCASICGAWVALHRATSRLVESGAMPAVPMVDTVAAVSVGLVDGEPLVDLDYGEDSSADADINVVMTGSGEVVEVQATAEGALFSRAELDGLLDLAAAGIAELDGHQRAAVEA